MQSILCKRCFALSMIVAAMVVGFVPLAGAGFFSFSAFAFPGASQTWAYGINSDGGIVGFFSLDGYHGYLMKDGRFTVLDAPWAVRNTMAFGINDEGQVVGRAGNSGFLLSDGTYQRIDVPGAGPSGTYAQAINNAGQIVGWYYGSDGQQHGFLLDAGVYSPIDVTLAGASNTVPTGINDKGEIVGYYTQFYVPYGNQTTGFLLRNGTYSALDIPGSRGPLPLPSQGFGINNLSMIVGGYSDGGQHGYLFFDGVFMLPINVPLPGGLDAMTFAINNNGSMVATNGGSSAFLIVPAFQFGGENQQ